MTTFLRAGFTLHVMHFGTGGVRCTLVSSFFGQGWHDASTYYTEGAVLIAWLALKLGRDNIFCSYSVLCC